LPPILAPKLVIFATDGAMLQRPPNGDRPVVPVTEPEPKAMPADGPDPRLVELVRLLARRAARQWYEKTMEERRAGRS